MPPRPAVAQLPTEVRDELNSRLIANGFGDYAALSNWLSQAGYEISKSALHRWGDKLEQEFTGAMADARRAAELGRALAGDDDGTGLRRATTAMAQETLLRVLMGLRQAESAATLEGEVDPGALAKSLSLVTRSLADLGRLGLADTKYATEQAKLALAAASEAVATTARGQGLGAEGIAALRAAIMGAL
ncbi:MAG: DUF3486 family protein [Chromatiaceae bacterium]|nr:DUF3486 family protein [Chromatiaceae bacterium]MBP8024082.1 DUF3486 family protein [Chromatiaceae bacterium]